MFPCCGWRLVCQCRDEGGERALTVPEKKISSSERDNRVAGSHDQCRRAEDIDSSCWLFIIGHRLYVLQKAPMSILSCINPSVTDCCHSTFTGAEKSGALPACHQSINQGFASDWWYQMQCRWEMNKRTHSCRTNKPFQSYFKKEEKTVPVSCENPILSFTKLRPPASHHELLCMAAGAAVRAPN